MVVFLIGEAIAPSPPKIKIPAKKNDIILNLIKPPLTCVNQIYVCFI